MEGYRVDFKELALRCELHGHQEDVRALATCREGFWTASRDKTCRLWSPEDRGFSSSVTLIGHTSYIGAVACRVKASEDSGRVVTGSLDKSAKVWDAQSGAELHHLQEHSYQVTAVAFGSGSDVITASADGTAKAWREGQCVATMEHNGSPVQCLLVLRGGDILTGASDGIIRCWQAFQLASTYKGHSDTVRTLALVPGKGIVSGSHDTSLRLWNAAGTCLRVLEGHTALVYAAAATPEGLVASASEDNTARLWQGDGTCLQVIPHPGCVWSVCFLPRGDLVTGCADSIARVWTATEALQAPQEERAACQQAVDAYQEANQPQSTGGPAGGLPPGLELQEASRLQGSGRKPGEVIVVPEGASYVAYSWDAYKAEWERIGDVMAGDDSGGGGDSMQIGGKLHNGQEWDFVFDVDVEDGLPVKKLPYNRPENPYDAADRFLAAENLPATYREQVVQFILQNAQGGAANPVSQAASNVDPFTGGGAYVPGSAPARPSGASSAAGNSSNADPFTGPGAYSSSRQQTSSPQPGAQQPGFTLFTAPLKAEAVGRKIREFNAALASSSDFAPLALSSEEEQGMSSLLQRASLPMGSPEGRFTPGDLHLLKKLLRWPAAKLFPGLDVARLMALQPAGQADLAADAGAIELSPLGCLGAALAAAAEPPQSAANQQTSLRLLANACAGPSTSGGLGDWVYTQAAGLLQAFTPAFQAREANRAAVRGAAAAFLLNLGHYHAGIPVKNDVSIQAVSSLAELTSACSSTDPEALARCFAAACRWVEGDPTSAGLAKALDLHVAAQQASQSGQPNVQQAAKQLLTLLR